MFVFLDNSQTHQAAPISDQGQSGFLFFFFLEPFPELYRKLFFFFFTAFHVKVIDSLEEVSF